MIRFPGLLTLFVFAVLAAPSLGQWGSRAGSVDPVVTQPQSKPAAVKWWKQPSGWYWLHRGDVQLGAWHPDRGYHAIVQRNPTTWQPAVSPVPLPVNAETAPIQNFGVDLAKLGETDGYTINGKPAGKEAAIEKLIETVPDDMAKLRMVVIGNDADQAKVKAAIAGSDALKATLQGVIVQSYEPDHFHVSGKFDTKGSPTIYFLKPLTDKPGKAQLLMRLDRFESVAQLERDASEAVKRADPNYRPKRPSPLPAIDVANLPPVAWALFGASCLAFLSFLTNRNRHEP